MKFTWTVYTADLAPGNAFDIIATKWTADGADVDNRKTVRTILGVGQAEANRQANLMQQEYDRTRNNIPVTA